MSDEDSEDSKTTLPKYTKQDKPMDKQWRSSNVAKDFEIKHVSVDLTNSLNDTNCRTNNCENSYGGGESPRTNIFQGVKKNYSRTSANSKERTQALSKNTSHTGSNKRIQRYIKDSVGSICNHKETLEEFKISFVEEEISNPPQRSKPKMTKIEMLNGDMQKPKLSTKALPTNAEVKSAQLKGNLPHKKKSSLIEKGIINLAKDNGTAKKFNVRNYSPRTRNQIPTVPLVQVYTCNTRRYGGSRLDSYRSKDTSPSAIKPCSTQIESGKTQEYFRTEQKVRRQDKDLSRSPSIGPVKERLSCKPTPKVISVPEEILKNKRFKSPKRSKVARSSNITMSTSKPSRNDNFLFNSPLKSDNDYSMNGIVFTASKCSPATKVYNSEDLMELEESVRKVQGYKDQIHNLSSQNMQMAECINYLQSELKKAKMQVIKSAKNRHLLSSKKLNFSKTRKLKDENKSNLTNSKAFHKTYSRKTSLARRKLCEGYVPLVSIDTNADSFKITTSRPHLYSGLKQ